MNFRHLSLSLIFSLTSLISVSQCLIENRGQWNGNFRYKAKIEIGSLFLVDDGLVFLVEDRSEMQNLHSRETLPRDTLTNHFHAFKLRLLGCNRNVNIEGGDFQSYYFNYYLGKNPEKWQSHIYGAGKVTYKNIYDGIDMVVVRLGDKLKYEFIVSPDADFRQIRIAAEGLNDIQFDRDQNLVMSTSIIDVTELKPTAYQLKGEKKIHLESKFVLAGNTISYSLDSYNPSLPIFIDPEIIFSTYCGANDVNWGYTATPDSKGFLYGGSVTFGNGFPATVGAYDESFNDGLIDVTISKYDTTGTSLVYATFLGGKNIEFPQSMIVDKFDNLLVFGTTGSKNFPTTTTAFDTSFNGGTGFDLDTFGIKFSKGVDMYVSKFSSNGATLLGSTYLGGSGRDGINRGILKYNYADELRGEINVDQQGNVYVVSSTASSNFPGTSGSYQSTLKGPQDGIISKLNSNLTSLEWSTYLGGTKTDAVYGIDFADDGSIYVCGGSNSTNYPTTSGAFQTSFAGGRSDGIISHLSADGKQLLHSTYFGSAQYDQLYLMQIGSGNHPHVFGQTENNGSSFIYNANFNNVGGGQLLANFNPNLGNLSWSTQFGSTPGRPNISPTSFLVDYCSSVYLVGWGGQLNQFFGSNNFNASSVQGLPVTSNAFISTPDFRGSDFYLCAISADANSLLYGTFYGGRRSEEHVDGGTSRFDRSGKIYQCVCAGCFGNSDFPIEPDPGAWSSTNNTLACASAVFKIDFQLPIIIADFDIPDYLCAPATIKLKNLSNSFVATTYSWYMNGELISNQKNPTYFFDTAGIFQIQLIINDPNSCNLSDTVSKLLVIVGDQDVKLPDLKVCLGESIMIGLNPDTFDILKIRFSWSPTKYFDWNKKVLNPTATVRDTTTFKLTINFGTCTQVFTQTVNVDLFPIDAGRDTIVCSSFSPFQVTAANHGFETKYEWSSDPEFNTIISNSETLSISNLPEALNYFYLRTTNDSGCTMLDTLLVTISDYDIYLTPDTSICKDDGARIEATSENPLNTFYYFWTLEPLSKNPNTALLTDSNLNYLEVTNTVPVTYYLYAKSKLIDGCSARDSVTVTVSRLDKSDVLATPPIDTFYLGESIQLHGEPSVGYDFGWEPGDYLSDSSIYNPVSRPKYSITYVYTVRDPEIPQCIYHDTVKLVQLEILCGEPEVFLPNAFTPNHDGLNDVLYLQGRNLETVNFSVYDRWGKLMFHTDDKSIGWDGIVNGEEVEPAVFVYYYEATCVDGQRIFRKGNVSVLAK